jgi:cell division protein FtsB
MNKNIKNILDKYKMLSDTRVLGLLAFGVVALLVTWSSIKVVQLNYELDKKISVAKQRNDVQRLRNENLKLKNTYYQTNQFLELSARRQFGKAAPGEKLYIVPKDVALSRTVETPKKEQSQAQAKAQSKFQKNMDDWAKFLFR